MVQLRVDVDAAQARTAFNTAARAVDNLGDQLTDARIDALRLEGALDDATREVGRLEQEIRTLDAAGGDSTGLRTQLVAARRAALDARDAVAHADHEVGQLARSLDDAEDEADRLRRTMDRLDADAGRGIRSMQRGLAGFAAQARQAGQQTARAFSDGFSGLPVEIKGAAILAGVAAAAAMAAAAGAAINALLVTAVGGGVLAAGISLAAKNSDAIQKAWSTALTPIGEEITRYSMMFEGPLIGAAGKFAAAWTRVGDDVRRIFALVTDEIDPLVEGLIGMAENALPGIEEAVAASKPVLQELAKLLPELGEGISDMFSSFSQEGQGAVKGMRALMLLLVGTLQLVGNTVEFLSGKFDDFSEAMEVVATAGSKIPLIGGAFDEARDFWADFNDTGEHGIKVLNAVPGAAGGAADSTFRLAAAEQKASKEAHELSEKLGRLISEALNADEAMLAWEEAIDGVTESVKENGRATDISTSKGRANVEAILAGVAAAEQKRQADIALAGGENAARSAVEAANAKFRDQLGQLEALLLKLGFTRAQVDALLGKYRELAQAPNITKFIDVNYRTRGTAAAAFQAPGSSIGSGNLRFAASGGSFRRGESAVVGEKGWELVTFNRDAQVHPHDESMRMLAGSGPSGSSPAGGGGGGSPRWSGSMAGLEALFFTWLQESIRKGKLRLA